MRKMRLLIAGVSVLAVLSLVFIYLFCWVTIKPGHIGIITLFGDMESRPVLRSGLHFVHPFASVRRISYQTTKNEEAISLPTKSGVAVTAKVVLIYHLDPEKLASIIRDVKGDFEETVIDPLFKNISRDVSAEYEAEALYTSGRGAVELGIKKRVQDELGSRGVIVEEVAIQDPVLPQPIVDRIYAKVGAEQDVIRMQSTFKIKEQEGLVNKRQKELEADSRIIEAKGIAESQEIIKKDLDDKYLIYLWIQALKENHGATIYVPTGHDGMPLFRALEKK